MMSHGNADQTLAELRQAVGLLRGERQPGASGRVAKIARELRRNPELRRALDRLLDRVAQVTDRPLPLPRGVQGTASGPAPSLTRRQKEILHWVAKGKSNTTIACILGISVHTVDTHLRRIFQRLGTTDRTVTALKAVQEGLIPAAA